MIFCNTNQLATILENSFWKIVLNPGQLFIINYPVHEQFCLNVFYMILMKALRHRKTLSYSRMHCFFKLKMYSLDEQDDIIYIIMRMLLKKCDDKNSYKNEDVLLPKVKAAIKTHL